MSTNPRKFIPNRPSNQPILILLVILLLLTQGLAACQNTDAPTPPPTRSTVTPTQVAVDPTATPIPIGSPERPFVLAVVGEGNLLQVTTNAESLAKLLSERSGITIKSQVFSSYTEMIKELENDRVHLLWLPPLTYLQARKKGLVEAFLLTNHFGIYQYGTQFLANVNSGFTPYFDPVTGKNTADASGALRQFQSRRPCLVEPQSAAGYILPSSILIKNKIAYLDPVIAQSHTAVVRALYIKGVCDFGATFSISGDPRSSSAVQNDLPDAMQRVMIIWRSEAVIPNLNLSAAVSVEPILRKSIAAVLLSLVETNDGKQLLSNAAGNYQIEGLKIIDDSLYDPLRSAVEQLKIDLLPMIGK
ncbi:MAG TPA: PhnD/SsuA/transferrin family substrate-binding protein [Anaerolineaceae bacterium]